MFVDLNLITDSDFYNIVIIGAMNPKIHHASWYRLWQLIDEVEQAEATANQNMFVVPNMSQFLFGDFLINCQENRWEIRVTNPQNFGRMADIACGVFDSLLPHTPVNAFGFYFVKSQATSSPRVATHLANSILHSSLGLFGEGATGADVILRRNRDGRSITTSVRPAKAESGMIISMNYEYKILPDIGNFDLKPLFAVRHPIDFQEFADQVQSIVRAIDLGTGG